MTRTGHSHGGATVLTALDQITAEMAGTPLRFAGGVAYCPPCAYEAGAYSSAEFYAPVLILFGRKDDWTPAQDCERLHARQHVQAPGRVRLNVLPGATHGFGMTPTRPAMPRERSSFSFAMSSGEVGSEPIRYMARMTT